MNGLALTDPRWLWALGALALPLAIHLWSRGRRRRVRIGSVALLEAAASQRLRKVRPTRLWLLALRCLLLAVVALGLAGLHAEPRPAPGEARWLLIDPALAHAEESPELASARTDWLAAQQAGERVSWLAPGLPSWEEDAAQPPSGRQDLWSLLQEAALEAAPTTQLAVYAADELSSLNGTRPTLRRGATWTSVAAGRTERWIEQVASTEQGAAQVRWAHGDATRVQVETATLPAREPAAGPAAVALGEAGPRWASSSEVEADVPAVRRVPEPRRLRVLLVQAADRSADARYVEAALAAWAQNRDLEIAWIRTSPGELDSSGSEERFDRLVWLADGFTAEALAYLAPEGLALSDASRPWDRCDRSAELPDGGRLRLVRCYPGDPVGEGTGGQDIDAGAAPSEGNTSVVAASQIEPSRATSVLWRDSAGQPLLTATRMEAGTHLAFLSRFHTDASDLVTQPAFPRWLGQWIAPAPSPLSEAAIDPRRAPATMASPHGGPSEPERSRRQPEPGPGSRLPVWALATILLVVERVWATR